MVDSQCHVIDSSHYKINVRLWFIEKLNHRLRKLANQYLSKPKLDVTFVMTAIHKIKKFGKM